MAEADIQRTIDAVWRIESAKLIAALARLVRDVGLAEDLAQDALLAALEQWPVSGVPDNPDAWLMTTAKNRAINHWRRGKLVERKHQELGRQLDLERDDETNALDEALDDQMGAVADRRAEPRRRGGDGRGAGRRAGPDRRPGRRAV